MSYNAKNYTEQGGDVTHFGGTVVFEAGSTVQGLSADPISPATAAALGGVKVGAGLSVDADGTLSVTDAVTPQECPEDLTDAPTAADFNALLAKLVAAGVLEEE